MKTRSHPPLLREDLSFWDASIIAAAEVGRCEGILSEDMNAGQIYCGVKMINPLAEEAEL